MKQIQIPEKVEKVKYIEEELVTYGVLEVGETFRYYDSYYRIPIEVVGTYLTDYEKHPHLRFASTFMVTAILEGSLRWNTIYQRELTLDKLLNDKSVPTQVKDSLILLFKGKMKDTIEYKIDMSKAEFEAKLTRAYELILKSRNSLFNENC